MRGIAVFQYARGRAHGKEKVRRPFSEPPAVPSTYGLPVNGAVSAAAAPEGDTVSSSEEPAGDPGRIRKKIAFFRVTRKAAGTVCIERNGEAAVLLPNTVVVMAIIAQTASVVKSVHTAESYENQGKTTH